MSEIISKALCEYETLIVILDVKYIDLQKKILGIDIDIKNSNSDKDKLENFCNLLNVTGLLQSPICFMKDSSLQLI